MSLATVVQSSNPPVLGLDVFVFSEGTATVVAFCGEADIATLPLVVQALSHVIADRRGDVVVDLAQVEFIDTATLRAVLRAKDALDNDGRQLTLRSPSSIACRLLTVFGLSDLVAPQRTAAR